MAGTNITSPLNSTLSIRETDASGLALSAICTGVPPTTAGIFQHGCLIIRTDSGSGNKATYENTGTTASPVWNLIGDVAASEITLVEGSMLIGNSSGVATALDIKTSGQIMVGNGTTATSVAVSGDATLASTGAVTIANSAVTLAKLASGVAPSHVIKVAGTTAAYGGGGTSNAFVATGVAATDIMSAVIRTSANDVAIVKAVPTTNTLTITFSADPGAGTTVDYIAARAAA